MINFVFRRFVQSFRHRQCLYFFINRKETTSLVKTRNEIQEQLEKKLKPYVKTYEDLIGITKLDEMNNKLSEIQTNLQLLQEKRRKVQEEIFMVHKNLQEMQDILNKTSVGDDMYISVATQVRELLKEQKYLKDTFSLYDQTERELQTALFMDIKNSQDHEKTYREKTKYISVIAGVVCGFLGFLASSINWHYRKNIKHVVSDISDLKKSVEELKLVNSTGEAAFNASVQPIEVENLLSTIKSQHNKLDDIIKSLQSLMYNGITDEVENLLTTIKSQHNELDDSIKSLQSLMNNSTTDEVENLLSIIMSQHNKLYYSIKSLQSVLNNSTTDEVENLLTTIKSQHDKLDDSIKSSQSLMNNSTTNKNSNNLKYDGHIQDSLNEFERNIESKLNNHTCINLIGSLFFSLIMFYITKSN